MKQRKQKMRYLARMQSAGRQAWMFERFVQHAIKDPSTDIVMSTRR
jgi:hypothetical protein